MPGKQRDHYSGDYSRRARAVRQAAYLNPDTRCWRPDCRRTLAEHGTEWQAGHVIDGQRGGQLLPECQPCNAKHGALRRHALARRVQSRDW